MRHADGDLGRAALVEPADDQGREAPGDRPHHRAADELLEEAGSDLGDVERRPADHGGEESREERDGGGIVEQALTLDEGAQAARRSDLAEDGDDRHGVGRGDDRGEEQAGHEALVADREEGRPGAQGAQHHRHDRQHQHRPEVVQQRPRVDGEGGLEQQQGEEHPQEETGRDRDGLDFHQELDQGTAQRSRCPLAPRGRSRFPEGSRARRAGRCRAGRAARRSVAGMRSARASRRRRTPGQPCGPYAPRSPTV